MLLSVRRAVLVPTNSEQTPDIQNTPLDLSQYLPKLSTRHQASPDLTELADSVDQNSSDLSAVQSDVDTIAGDYLTADSLIGYATESWASGQYSVASGGSTNEASGDYSSVSAGENNDAAGDYSSIYGDEGLTASNDYRFEPEQ